MKAEVKKNTWTTYISGKSINLCCSTIHALRKIIPPSDKNVNEWTHCVSWAAVALWTSCIGNKIFVLLPFHTVVFKFDLQGWARRTHIHTHTNECIDLWKNMKITKFNTTPAMGFFSKDFYLFFPLFSQRLSDINYRWGKKILKCNIVGQ